MVAKVKTKPSLRSEQATQALQRILQAAEEVFAEEGFAGARIEDVAERAGVAVPTVYKVFTNKRNLLVGALNRAMTGGDPAGVDEHRGGPSSSKSPIRRANWSVARNAPPDLPSGPEQCSRSFGPPRRSTTTWPTPGRQITTERLARSRTTAKRFLAKAGPRARVDRPGIRVDVVVTHRA